MFKNSRIESILAFSLLITLVFISFRFTNSETIKCSPDQITVNGLVYGSESENVKNFKACLRLLNLYTGDVSNKYDDNLKNAMKKFYISIRKYNPFDPLIDLDSLSLSVSNNDLNLIKNMARMKLMFNENANFQKIYKKIELPSNYSLIDKLSVDDKFQNILISYKNRLNKINVIKVNVTSSNIISFRTGFARMFDFVPTLGFDKGKAYFTFSHRGRNYLIVENNSYGPFDGLLDFKIYDNDGTVILYTQNRFLYSILKLGSSLKRIGPFNNLVGTYIRLSPYEPKIGFIAQDPLAMDKLGEQSGQYVGIIDINNSFTVSDFSLINKFNFARVNESGSIVDGYLFSFKPLWQNVTNPSPDIIHEFMSDWLYISGDNLCKNYRDYKDVFNQAYNEHRDLMAGLNRAMFTGCQIITSTVPTLYVNEEYVDKVFSSNFALDFNQIQYQMESPLSVCGPYNRIHNIYLSNDNKKAILTYSKKFGNSIKRGILGINLTKIDTISPSGGADCNNWGTVVFRGLIRSCDIDINIVDRIVNCYPALSKFIKSVSPIVFDFYSGDFSVNNKIVNFDEDLGVIFSKQDNRFAFFYRTLDKYYVSIFEYPPVAVAKKIKPITTYENVFSKPIQKFTFSPDGKNYAFLVEEDNQKKVYLNDRVILENIDEIGDFVFSKKENILSFWYIKNDDSNKYVALFDSINFNIIKTIGPFTNNVRIRDIVLSENGSKIAIVLIGEDRKPYVYYENRIYHLHNNGQVGFAEIKDEVGRVVDTKLIALYLKEELINEREKRMVIYFVTPYRDQTDIEFDTIINSMI
ncbi:MAG: hypothetical protein NZ822_01740 [Patescibacteria group bacterium]|nr:hypothetical protein [Patescibacteria group bacterium]